MLTDRQTDRKTVRWMDENTDMTKLIVAFLNFANTKTKERKKGKNYPR